jgi:hypothetical protein
VATTASPRASGRRGDLPGLGQPGRQLGELPEPREDKADPKLQMPTAITWLASQPSRRSTRSVAYSWRLSRAYPRGQIGRPVARLPIGSRAGWPDVRWQRTGSEAVLP